MLRSSESVESESRWHDALHLQRACRRLRSALWTDTNNKQSVVWFYGFEFVPTPINQEDVATASGNF